MKRLLVLGVILLSQNPAFSRPQCPSGTAPIGPYETRDYKIVGWKGEQNGYRCVLRTYLECGDLVLNAWARPIDTDVNVLSKQKKWINFTHEGELYEDERRGYNQSTQEVYSQKIKTGYFKSPGVSKLLQVSGVIEGVQKCGRPSF